MFELLFGHPWTAFSKGSLVLLGRAPAWLLPGAVLAGSAAIAWFIFGRGAGRRRAAVLWILESAFLAVLLAMLWRPALSVASLKPQENIVAVLVDDSGSMAIREDGRARIEQASAALGGGVLEELKRRFQVRLYRFGAGAERIDHAQGLKGGDRASRIGDALARVSDDAAGLPLGAIVLMTDGADNSGGVDAAVINELRQKRVPVDTVGFGRERIERDVEIASAAFAPHALTGTRVIANVAIRSDGFKGRAAKLSITDAGRVLASRNIELRSGEQNEAIAFNAGTPGARAIQVAVEPVGGEENTRNNRVTRLLNVDARKPRILYLEGEPRWEYKFIRRALEDDGALQLVSLLRTTQNKVYRQGIASPAELEHGFPAAPEELFAFDGVILGSVEAGYFTPGQQALLREFADRRGGGVLFLGGRAALADGGYASGPLAEMLPVELPQRRNSFVRENASVQLTAAGALSPLLRLVENPDANVERWKTMPPVADYQDAGTPKPGALALADAVAGGRKLPFLITENYGHGRTAVLATGGTWRWQMRQDHTDRTHETFWRQLLRWLVADTPGQVSATTPEPVLSDTTRVPLRAEVRDKAFRAVGGARVEAHVIGPGGTSTFELQPDPRQLGVYTANWSAEPEGSYVAEIVARRGAEEVGRDVVSFRREDGVAENFRTAQNRDLLERIASETGGRYYRPQEAAKLAREVQYSEAGITVRETHDLWNMPALLALALALRSGGWLLRRKWGLV